jgi:hypothetical protein
MAHPLPKNETFFENNFTPPKIDRILASYSPHAKGLQMLVFRAISYARFLEASPAVGLA